MLNHELIEDRLSQIRISANRLKLMQTISKELSSMPPLA